MIKIADLSYHDNRKTKTGQLGIRPTVVIGGNTGNIDVNVHANSAYVLKEHIEVSDIKALYDYIAEVCNEDSSILYKTENSDYMNFYTNEIDMVVGEDVLVYTTMYGSFDESNTYVYINGQWENGNFDWDDEEVISLGTKNTDKKFISLEAKNHLEEEEKEIYNNVIEKLKPFIQEEVKITRPIIKQVTFKQSYSDYLPRKNFAIAGFVVKINDRGRSEIITPYDLAYWGVSVGGRIEYEWNEDVNGDRGTLTDMSKLTVQFDEGMMKQLELLSDEIYEDFLNIFETIEYK